jgi:hypothetical protein
LGLSQRSGIRKLNRKENMDIKCKAKVNKLGEMINALLMKTTEDKKLYGDVYKLREKHDELCVLIKKDKSVSIKQARFFKARAFERSGKASWPTKIK